MSEHIFIVIILLQTSYLLNNILQYNSSQDYFLQAPIWDRPFKKTPISFSLHNLKIIHHVSTLSQSAFFWGWGVLANMMSNWGSFMDLKVEHMVVPNVSVVPTQRALFLKVLKFSHLRILLEFSSCMFKRVIRLLVKLAHVF